MRLAILAMSVEEWHRLPTMSATSMGSCVILDGLGHCVGGVIG
jgi:hypothetical protein